MKKWLESYRPVSQRTLRSKTTKDKAGALPPAVYTIQPTGKESDERLPFPGEIDIIRSTLSKFRTTTSCQCTNVDYGDFSEMFEDHKEVQISDKYETDSDDDETENVACMLEVLFFFREERVVKTERRK